MTLYDLSQDPIVLGELTPEEKSSGEVLSKQIYTCTYAKMQQERKVTFLPTPITIIPVTSCAEKIKVIVKVNLVVSRKM